MFVDVNEAARLNEAAAAEHPDALPARRRRALLADLEAFKRDAEGG